MNERTNALNNLSIESLLKQIFFTIKNPRHVKKSNGALARTPRVLHPGVLLRTNQAVSRNLDFLFFFPVSKVIKNKLISGR
jgi:hypothetical protein